MAGMFSLLRKSQLRLDMTSGSTGGCEDNSSDFRKKSGHRSPLPGGKRILRQVHMKTMNVNADRVPKRFRKRRCNEIHPLLRRSVCTILLAACGIATGIALLLIDLYTYQSIPNSGVIVLVISCLVFVVGAVWFWWSTVQLKKYREKIAALHSDQDPRKENTSTTEQPFVWQRAFDATALSATKWPTKRVMAEECSDSSTPNGSLNCEVEDARKSIKQNHHAARCIRDCSVSIESESSLFDNEDLAQRKRNSGASSSVSNKTPPVRASSCNEK